MLDIRKVKATKYYKSLDHIQKVMLIKKVNLLEIELGINMSSMKGIEFWIKTTSPNARIESVVRELTK